MSIQKKLKKLSLTILGCQAERWDDTWDQVNELTDAFGERPVADTFQEWAESRKGEIITRPLQEFLKVAPGLIQGITSLKPKPELTALINDLAGISDGRVLFDKEQQVAVGRLLAAHLPEDVKSAFRTFFDQVDGDDFLVKRAAKTFTETAEQLLTLQVRRREEARKTQEAIVRATERERATAEAEFLAMMKRDADEADLIEDVLPTE